MKGNFYCEKSHFTLNVLQSCLQNMSVVLKYEDILFNIFYYF